MFAWSWRELQSITPRPNSTHHPSHALGSMCKKKKIAWQSHKTSPPINKRLTAKSIQKWIVISISVMYSFKMLSASIGIIISSFSANYGSAKFGDCSHLVLKRLCLFRKPQRAEKGHNLSDCPQWSVWWKITFTLFSIFSWITNCSWSSFPRRACERKKTNKQTTK